MPDQYMSDEQKSKLSEVKNAIMAFLGNADRMSISQYGDEIDVSATATMIVKSDAECLVTGVVLEPEVTDSHGDIYSEEEIYKAMESFNVHCRRNKLQHQVDSGAVVVESWTAKNDETIGGQEVKKGTWLMTTRLPPEEFALVQKGVFTGYSVGCKASTEYLEKSDKPRRRLTNFDFSKEGAEVSLVDKAANKRTILVTKSEAGNIENIEKGLMELLQVVSNLMPQQDQEQEDQSTGSPLQSVMDSLNSVSNQLTKLINLNPEDSLMHSSLEEMQLQPATVPTPQTYNLEKSDMPTNEEILKSLQSEEGQALLSGLIQKATAEKDEQIQKAEQEANKLKSAVELIEKREQARADQEMAATVAKYEDLGVKAEDVDLFKSIASTGEENFKRFQEILEVSKSALDNAGALEVSGADSVEEVSSVELDNGIPKEIHNKAVELQKSDSNLTYEQAILAVARS